MLTTFAEKDHMATLGGGAGGRGSPRLLTTPEEGELTPSRQPPRSSLRSSMQVMQQETFSVGYGLLTIDEQRFLNDKWSQVSTEEEEL